MAGAGGIDCADFDFDQTDWQARRADCIFVYVRLGFRALLGPDTQIMPSRAIRGRATDTRLESLSTAVAKRRRNFVPTRR